MKLWVDTEFNSFCGELISIGVVAEDGKSFYAVVEYDITKMNPWVLENVIPKLGEQPITLSRARTQLAAFLRQFPTIEVIADWPEDLAHFLNLQVLPNGTRFSTPPQTLTIVEKLEPVSSNPHNALSDAKALMEAFLAKK